VYNCIPLVAHVQGRPWEVRDTMLFSVKHAVCCWVYLNSRE